MDNRTQLQPLELRPEAQPGYQKLAWQPTWKCFCCHDTGMVVERLIRQIIPRYAHGRHKPVECNATNCNIQLAQLLYTTHTLDRRFTDIICDRLDLEERNMWSQWNRQRHEQKQQRLELVESPNLTKNLRARARTNDEQLEVNRRHQRIKSEY